VRWVNRRPKRSVKYQRNHQSRWTIAIHVSLMVALCVSGMYLMVYQFAATPQDVKPLSDTSLQPVPSLSVSVSASVVPEPTTATPLPSITIAPGDVKQLYIPATDPNLAIDTPVAPMPTNCSVIINPPQSTRAEALSVYQCMDFSAPGTDALGTTVLAGHSSLAHSWNTVFDHLQQWGDSIIGRTVYLRTTTSQGHWLLYKVTNVYRPSKSTGADNAVKQEIWKPTPGRLLLVTCLELGNVPSVDNYIVVAQYEGIQ
jgi:Sortase domain